MGCFKHGMDYPNTVWDINADAKLEEAIQLYGPVDNWALGACSHFLQQYREI